MGKVTGLYIKRQDHSLLRMGKRVVVMVMEKMGERDLQFPCSGGQSSSVAVQYIPP